MIYNHFLLGVDKEMSLLSHVARQPILNRKKTTVAYELLFRDGASNSFPNVDPNTATSKILFDNLIATDFEKITDGKLVFINFTQTLLEQHIPLVVSNKQCVIEILESCKPTQKLLNAIKFLKQKNYKMALDDFIYDKNWEPFFPYIDIIKVDIEETPISTVKEKFTQIKNKHNVLLLAERVETKQDFNDALDAGFSLFQGYFFSKPEIIQQRRVSPSKLTILRLLNNVNADVLDFDELESTISTDPTISYKFLQYVNSAYSDHQTISSLKQALVYLGEAMVKRFATLVITSDATGSKPSILFLLSLQRAYFLEACIVTYRLNISKDTAFLTGLFSLMDVLLDIDKDKILQKVSLDPLIYKALINKEGELSTLISIVECIEQAQWNKLTLCVEKTTYNEEELFQLHHNAFKKADEHNI